MRIRTLLVGALAVVLPVVAGAGVYRGMRGAYTVAPGATAEHNVYAVSEFVAIAGELKEDLTAAGERIRLLGTIKKDALLAGSDIEIVGSVGEDLRFAGGDTMLMGSVGGDLAAVGGRIYLAPGSSVARDTYIIGGTVKIEGNLLGTAKISAGEMMINGRLAKDAVLESGRLVIGPTAVIDGAVSYRGRQAPVIMSGAKINGKINFVADDFGGREFMRGLLGLKVLFVVLMLLASTLLSCICFFVFKHRVHALMHAANSFWWKSVGRGALVFILLPILSVICMGSIIGLPIGLFGLLGFGAFMILGQALGGIIGAHWLMRVLLRKGETYELTPLTLIVGVLAVRLIGSIPVVGWVVSLMLLLVSIGVMYSGFSHWVRNSR